LWPKRIDWSSRSALYKTAYIYLNGERLKYVQACYTGEDGWAVTLEVKDGEFVVRNSKPVKVHHKGEIYVEWHDRIPEWHDSIPDERDEIPPGFGAPKTGGGK